MLNSIRIGITLAFGTMALTATCLAQTMSSGVSGNTPPVLALNGPPIQIDPATRDDFQKVFALLSKRAHVAILMEGAPLASKLTPESDRALEAMLPAGEPHSLSETVTAVAKAYDYDVAAGGQGVLLLNKRYSNPVDLPVVTCSELLHSLQEMAKALAAMGDSTEEQQPPYVSASDFVQQLTPEQRSKLPSGLPFADMTESERSLALRSLSRSLLFPNDNLVFTTIKHLKTLSDPATVFTWMTVNNVQAFGYRGRFGPADQIWDFPMGGGFYDTVSGAKLSDVRVNGRAIDVSDPTVPTAEDFDLALHTPRLACTHTIKELVEGASDPALPVANAPARTAVRAYVDDTISNKPVSAFGIAGLPRLTLLRAIGALYGLEVYQRQKDRYVLTLPTIGQIHGMEEYRAAIDHLTPLPVAHAFRRQTDLEKQRAAEQALKVKSGEARGSAFINQIGYGVYYYPAVRRLQVLAKPFVPTPESKPVPVAGTGSSVRDLIAVAMLSGDCIRAIDSLRQMELPIVLSNPTLLVVKGGTGNGAPVRGISYGELNARGVFQSVAGSTIPPPRPNR